MPERLLAQKRRSFQQICVKGCYFMSKTLQLLTARCGKIRPDSVAEFVAAGGFEAFQKAIKMEPMEIINQVMDANLLGRGGASYPAGKKWKQLYEIEGTPKYIVCNADEGEPGTFKDKVLLEKDPLGIIEGMMIAGYVFGSNDGYIYIRGEYREIQKLFQKAIDSAVKANYLGEHILGTDFTFHVHIVSGAGAYICGENSGLLNSIEARTGRPRVKPPHLAEVGLYSKPTLVNNVESFANIPIIINMGGKAFADVGSEGSGGTKLICLSGNIRHKGTFEVPIGGVTLRDIIYDKEFGGGIPDGKELKFYHLGGQSGPIGFPDQLDTPYSHASLKKQGLSIGSGAVVVMDESVCVIDYLKKVSEFFIHESCGKCVPCREGNRQMYLILHKFATGMATEKDLDRLERLSFTMAMASSCGLGQAAATALDSCMKHDIEEFKAHIKGICPVCLNSRKYGDKYAY